jgi:hypothetical protein
VSKYKLLSLFVLEIINVVINDDNGDNNSTYIPASYMFNLVDTLNLRSMQSPFVIVDRNTTLHTQFLGTFTIYLHTHSQLQLFITYGHQTKSQIYILCSHHFVVLHLTYEKFHVFLKTCYCTQFQDLRFNDASIAPPHTFVSPPCCKLNEIKKTVTGVACNSTTSIPNFVILVTWLKK